MQKLEISKSKRIILSALFLSLGIILERIVPGIKTPIMKLSFGFIPIMFIAMWLGPKSAAIIAGLQDLIGALLFPFGTYFPGWTISYVISGYIYGLILHKKQYKYSNFELIARLLISSILVLGIVNIILDSYWLKISYGQAYIYYISTRFISKLIMIPIQVIVMFVLERSFRSLVTKYIYDTVKIDNIEYLEKFVAFTKRMDLSAMEWLLREFGNPHEKIKFIHIAGTNGKGSVCEMIYSVLLKQGYVVGKYMSPHLISYNERICVNDVEISDEEMEEILEQISLKVDEYNKTHKIKVTQFEVITTMALIYFAKKKCDFVVLETGLGGRLDCTNIVYSLVSVITTIGYDHMNVLGNTLEQIAGEKAGIIKENSDTIFIHQNNITKVIENKCKEKNSTLYILDREDIKNYSRDDIYQYFDYKNYKTIKINLKGKIQTENAIRAIECLEVLRKKGYEISDKSIYDGLSSVGHRAVFEIIKGNPKIIYDGGHNENAIKNLKSNIEEYYKTDKRVYIISILKRKDYRKIIKELSDDKDAIFIFTSGNSKTDFVSRKVLSKEAKKYIDKNNIYDEELKDAIEKCKNEYKDRVTFIIGSFYIYNDVIKAVGEKND